MPMHSTGNHGWLEIGRSLPRTGTTRLTLRVTGQKDVDQALVERAEQRFVVDVDDEFVPCDPGTSGLDVDHDPEPLVEERAEPEVDLDQIGIGRPEHLVDVEVELKGARCAGHL